MQKVVIQKLVYRYVSFKMVIWCGSYVEWWYTFIWVLVMGDSVMMVWVKLYVWCDVVIWLVEDG